MSWFFRMYVRRFFRSWMAPMPGEHAKTWHRRLTILYIFFAWNAGGWAIYGWYRTKDDPNRIQDKTNAHFWGRTLGIQEAKIVRFSSKGLETCDFNHKEYAKEVTPKTTTELKSLSPSD